MSASVGKRDIILSVGESCVPFLKTGYTHVLYVPLKWLDIIFRFGDVSPPLQNLNTVDIVTPECRQFSLPFRHDAACYRHWNKQNVYPRRQYFSTILARWHTTLDAFCSKRFADLLRTVGSLYQIDSVTLPPPWRRQQQWSLSLPRDATLIPPWWRHQVPTKTSAILIISTQVTLSNLNWTKFLRKEKSVSLPLQQDSTLLRPRGMRQVRQKCRLSFIISAHRALYPTKDRANSSLIQIGIRVT